MAKIAAGRRALIEVAQLRVENAALRLTIRKMRAELKKAAEVQNAGR